MFYGSISGNAFVFQGGKGVKCCFNTDKAYIAVSDISFKNRDYSALLGSGIFENRSNEKGDRYLATVIKQISGRHKHF